MKRLAFLLILLFAGNAYAFLDEDIYEYPQMASSQPVTSVASCGAFPCSSIVDSFTRADENPLSGGGNWLSGAGTGFVSSNNGNLKLVSNQVEETSTGGNLDNSAWGTSLAAGRHDVFVKVNGVPAAGEKAQLYCKMSSFDKAGNGYQLFIRDGNQRFFRVDAGSDATGLGAGSWTQTISAGDVLGIRCDNDASGTLSFYQNGSLVGTVTDATYKDQAGYSGIGCNYGGCQLDDFGTGKVN